MAVLGTAGPGAKNICVALVLYNFHLLLGVGPLLAIISAEPGAMPPLGPLKTASDLDMVKFS